MAPFSHEEPGETDSGETAEASAPATLDPLTAPLAEVLGEAPLEPAETHLTILEEPTEVETTDDETTDDETTEAEVETEADRRPTVANLPTGVVDVEDFSPSARVDVFAALRGDSAPVEQGPVEQGPVEQDPVAHEPVEQEPVETVPEPIVEHEPEHEPEPVIDEAPARAERFETLEQLLASVTGQSPEAARPEPEPMPPEPDPDPVPEPQPTPTQTTVVPPAREATGRTEPDHETIDLSPRGNSRTVLLALLGLAVVAAAVLAWRAWQDPSTTAFVLAGVAAVVALALWKAHGRSAPSTVKVERGNLDIRTRDSHHRFDLASPTTRYETVGTPGRRGWKVLIHRTGMPPYVVDAGLVDADAFTRALERLQPQATEPATPIQ